MTMAIAEARPPYVRFETRSVEDRQASIEQGHYVGKDVDYALVTPQGSRDCYERVATEWLDSINQRVQEGRFPADWHRHFTAAYEAFRNGREAPLSGTDIGQWGVLSPTQLKTLRSVNIRTIEDVATANEEGLMRMGMGARELQRKAKDWLAAASGIGKLTEELAALRSANEDLKVRNASLEGQVKGLMVQLENVVSTKPGSKPL